MMKDESLTPKLTIPFFDKVCAVEFFQNRSENLLAVGLKASVDVINIIFDDSNATVGFEFVHKLDHGCRVQCLAWSPATSFVTSPKQLRYASGGADHNVRLVSLDLGSNPKESVKTLKGHRNYVNSLAYQPEVGSQVVSGSDDHTVMLWDAINGHLLHSITFRAAVMSLAWHPEEVSKLMIGEKNGVVHIYNIVSYHPIMSLDCGPGPLSSFDWSLVNSLLVAVAVRSDVTVWDLSKMNPVSKTYLRQDIVRHVKMSPVSESVFATSGLPNYNVKICNTKNSHVFQVMANLPIGGISWHPKKNILAVGHDEKISVFQIASSKIQT